MNNLATSYADAGRIQDALRLREETFRLMQAKLGPDHPDTLRSMNNLALSYTSAGHIPKAVQLHEETLQLRQAKFGPDHPDTLRSMHNLAHCYAAAGRHHEALTLREELLRLRRAKIGSDHPETLSSMNNLALSYEAVGRVEEAVKLHEETLQLCRTKMGADHPLTLWSMMGLANSYYAAGRFEEALKLFEETLHLRRAKLGPDHPETLRSLMGLARSCADAGRIQEAVKLFKETHRLMHAKFGPDHPQTLASMNNLAASYLSAKRHDDAASVLHEALSRRQARLDAQPGNSGEAAYLAWTLGQLGEVEQARFDFPAALKAYRQSLHLFDQLSQAGAQIDLFCQGRMTFYQQQLAHCAKVEQAVRDLDFALGEPGPAAIPLLDARVRYFLREKQLTTAVESAAKARERAKKAEELYLAACLYALCAAAKASSTPASLGKREDNELADEAMRLLTLAAFKGFRNAGRMMQDPDMEALRPREDFQKLAARLERK
ncbi:MAG: tetratricopeptide repeat protein [Gemmataceae bacterium]|nr:tetratricopeptide repeat protein [Gemmataceae bacterium]